MAGTIKGILVEIGGDTSGLQKAISKVNTATSSLSKELRGINSLLKLDPRNTELVSQKQKILAENIEATSKKLEELKKVEEMANSERNKVSDENYRNLQREIANTEYKLKQLQVQASKWTKAGESLEEFSNKVTRISKKIDGLGSTLTTGLTLPIFAIGTAATTVGNEFEAKMSKVQAIAGATKEELEKLTETAIELGSKTSFSSSQVAEGMENLASAGFTTNEIIKSMPGLLDLAASSGTELAVAAEITASAIRGFGLEANTSAHIADVFAEAAARTNAQTEDMGEAMKYVAPVAKTVGLSIEETAAAIGIMSDAGVKGSQAGTTLRGGLTRIVKPTKMVRDAMEELGVEFYNSNGKMKSLTEIIQTLQKHTKGLTDETKNQALAQIFGTEALSGMLALVNRGSSELESMTKSFKECDGAAAEMAETMLDNTAGSLESLSGSFESAGIAIQKALSPQIRDLAKWIQGLVDDFTELSEEEQQNIVKNALLVASIGPAVKILGKLGKGIGSATKSLSTFTKALAVAKNNTVSNQASVNALAQKITFLTTPLGLATTAVVALSTAFAANYIATAKEKASLGGLSEEIEKQSDKWKELNNARNENINNILPEIEISQKLANELRTITDENGKVKQGYENRAQTILTELNKALGTEYKMNGNIISQYKELKENIDKIIASKKAESVLNAYQEEYGTALKEQAKATSTLVKLKEEQAEISEKMAMGNVKERKEAEIKYNYINQKIKEQTDLIGKYGKTITDIENLQTASATGSTEQINQAIAQLEVTYENVKQKSKESIEQQIINQSKYVSTVKESLTEAKKTNDEYQTYILNSQLNTENQKLADLINSFAKQTSTIQELTPQQGEAWKAIAKTSYEEYSKALYNIDGYTRKRIESVTGIIATDPTMPNQMGLKAGEMTTVFNQNLSLAKPTEEEVGNASSFLNSNKSLFLATENIADKSSKKFEEYINSENGRKATNDYMDGAENGINRKKKSFLDLLFGIGRQGNQRMRDGLGDGSPSILAERALVDYFLGADIGIEKQGDKTIRNIEDYAKKMNTQFNKTMINKNFNTNGISRAMSSRIMNTNKTIFTTPQIVFNVQQLDEKNLDKCFNYINKKFGSKY